MEIVVQSGVQSGWIQAYNGVDDGEAPTPKQIKDSIYDCVMASIEEVIIFDEDSNDLELTFPEDIEDESDNG